MRCSQSGCVFRRAKAGADEARFSSTMCDRVGMTHSWRRVTLARSGARVDGKAVVADTPLTLTPLAAAALEGRADVVRSAREQALGAYI